MTKRILWIEDHATVDLREYAGPVYAHGDYDLVVAFNAADGVARALKQTFDVVIVDIRIPPGDDSRWVDLYKEANSDKIQARLGIQLMYSLLGHGEARVPLAENLPWLTAEKIAVFTVEARAELRQHLIALGIRIHREKGPGANRNTLIELIDEVSHLGMPKEV